MDGWRPDTPAHDELADLLDTDDWDIHAQGRMKEFATDGDEVDIITYERPLEVKPDASDDEAPE